MKQYKGQLTGTGMVYRFTLTQFLKNKANMISLIIIILFSIASVPVTSLIGNSGSTALYSDVANVYFSDCAEPYALTGADLQNAADENEFWSKTTFPSGRRTGGQRPERARS